MHLGKIKKQVSQYAIKHNFKNVEVGIFNKGCIEYISNGDIFQNAYQIGSISKVFTAFTIMLGTKEKKINLSNTIQDFFPEITMNDDNATITINELLTHTSGLPSIPSYSIKQSYFYR
jgi:CubicO group peptidase (beta-lactamase class C family)